MSKLIQIGFLLGSSWVIWQVPLLQDLILAGCLLMALVTCLLGLVLLSPMFRGLLLVVFLTGWLLRQGEPHWAAFLCGMYLTGLICLVGKAPISPDFRLPRMREGASVDHPNRKQG